MFARRLANKSSIGYNFFATSLPVIINLAPTIIGTLTREKGLRMELHYQPEIKAVVDGMALGMPGVTVGSAFGHPAYKVNGKVFAVVGMNGVAIKLPKERVQALITEHPAYMTIFKPDGQRLWREWLSLELDDPQGYEQYTGLLEESVSFVSR